MRVAILTQEYPPHIFGGIGTFVQNLAEALPDLGVEVVVIAGSSEQRAQRETATSGSKSIELVWFPRGPLPPRHLWFQLRNSAMIRRELSRCDVVHGQDSSSFPILGLCRRFGPSLPWVITFHTNPQAELRLALSSFLRGGSLSDLATYAIGFPLWDLTVREHLRQVDSLVAVSESLRDELCDGYRVDRQKMVAIPTCINADRLRSFSETYRVRYHNSAVHLFYAGRLYYRKGIMTLVKSIRHLLYDLRVSNFELRVFGTGPLYKALASYVRQNGLEAHVKLRGFVPRRTLLGEMIASDIVCVPSMYEACPLTMLEAMSLGKPVVAFDLPFSREILGRDSGLLCKDSLDFARKLAQLIESSYDRNRHGRKVESQAKRFDASVIAKMYHRMYTSCQ